MERFFKKQSAREPTSSESEVVSKQSRIEINLNELEADPGKRANITTYHPNSIEDVRRAYWLKGPCQPKLCPFPSTKIGDKARRFNSSWYSKYSSWLEYSVKEDALYCLCCYLFKPNVGDQGGGETFVGVGFRDWRRMEKLKKHVGDNPNSFHNQALSMCQNLLNQRQHIETVFSRQSNQARVDYRIRLNASIDCIRYLLKQGLALRGHHEHEDSNNRCNFLELLEFLADHNTEVANVVLKNAPDNLKLTSPDIQKDIVNAIATEIINAIMYDIGDEWFSLLVDESRDVSVKEQMAVALRYVNDKGHIMECFIGVEHVKSTTAISLKETIDSLFSRLGLGISMLRGQGYDGASNMRGEFNGLKTLILRENECAYYVHCFAHQLQLALVAVAQNHPEIQWFFNLVATLLNVVGGSCKRNDSLIDIQAQVVLEALNAGELESGQGLNQETSLARACDTRWGSHYETLMSLIKMFSAVEGVLELIRDEKNGNQRGNAFGLLRNIRQFDFAFNLHLMKTVLAITNELSQALQRRDQDIVNAMSLVRVSKKRLQEMRDSGWDSFLDQVSSFCVKHGINVPLMDEVYLVEERRTRRGQEITNLHHYRVELFYTVLDMQLNELNDRFSVITTELLICVACLNPVDSFSAFNKEKLVRLASFYPKDFTTVECMILEDQLDTYIYDMRDNDDFLGLNGVGELAEKLVQTKKNGVCPLVYRLVKLTLILPVATATVEKAFSAMKIVKNRLRNRMGDQLLNDSLVVYIEKNRLNDISNDAIIQRFQKMKNRRGHL